jgi:hypothetical protein
VVAGRGIKTAVAGTIVKESSLREAATRSKPIRDLGLTIAGTQLEPLTAEVMAEVERAGVRRLKPRFYLSTEWGVPTDSIAIAIPFYLAAPELTALQAERAGYVEGCGAGDILRYLRHEMGHAVNYAYRLYEDPEWLRRFGSFAQPYVEDYRPRPFSRRFVRHLPGWYAQMHPEEDWAETFAVWLTPGRDWRSEYAGWPEALGKLEYCDRVLKELGDREPLVSADHPDVDISEVEESLDQFYGEPSPGAAEFPPELDGELRAIFEDPGAPAGAPVSPDKAAAELIRRYEGDLVVESYRWTGHFPEDSRLLLRHLAERAERLQLGYPGESEGRVVVGLTTLVTALAMNYVHTGTYYP